MHSIIVNKIDYLNSARSLLHHYYLEHLEWEILHGNPSGIKIQRKNNQTIISDDYDDLAIWFSVQGDNNECVACGRLCYNDSKGLLELERYANARKSLQDILLQKKELNIIELNREAVLPKYVENNEPYLLLLKLIFEYCLKKGHSILTTCNLVEWMKIYDQIEFQSLKATFKYFDSEPEPVKIYFAPFNEIEKILDKICFLLKEL